MQSVPVPPRRADDATVTRRAVAMYESARADAVGAREALDRTAVAVAAMHRREPDDVRRALVASLPACERALLFGTDDVASGFVIVTVASAPEREPVADHADAAREALEVALDALHAAADASDDADDAGSHRRALASMRHVLRALRALDGVAR